MRESGAFSKVELDFFRAGEAFELDSNLDDDGLVAARPPRAPTEPPIADEDDSDEWEWEIALARARAN